MPNRRPITTNNKKKWPPNICSPSNKNNEPFDNTDWPPPRPPPTLPPLPPLPPPPPPRIGPPRIVTLTIGKTRKSWPRKQPPWQRNAKRRANGNQPRATTTIPRKEKCTKWSGAKDCCNAKNSNAKAMLFTRKDNTNARRSGTTTPSRTLNTQFPTTMHSKMNWTRHVCRCIKILRRAC